VSNGNDQECKIDPRLRRHALLGQVAADSDLTGYTCWVDPETRRPRSTPADATEKRKQDRYAQAFIEVADPVTMDWVKHQPGVKDFVNIVDGYCTATLRLDCITSIAAHQGVIEIEASRVCKPSLDQSVKSVHGWDGISPSDALGQAQGSGVVIGIVDYGLDFTLSDFSDQQTGKTRIAYLWDQQLKKVATEKWPAKYEYGVEYSADDIDGALKAKDPFSVVRHRPIDEESDVSGHGTHVAGIAAGNGSTSDAAFPAGRYVGVAPGATLVFVHLDRAAILAGIDSPEGTLANSINLAHAIAYCFEKADQLKMPCVVNLSMGFNGGGHDGDMVVEWIIDALVRKSGRAVVIAAGNENRPEKAIYFQGSVPRDKRIRWENGYFIPNPGGGVIPISDSSPREMEIWYSAGFSLRVRLIGPRGDQASEWVKPDDPPLVFSFLSGEQVVISSDQQTPWDGAARIHIELSTQKPKVIRAGTWVVELEAITASQDGIRYDAWIERTIPDVATRSTRSRFKDYDPEKAITVTTPGTARHAITVASCDSRAPIAIAEISSFSGCGPTRDVREKPDLAAPGQLVTSTNAGAGRTPPGAAARIQKQGTSMSAPHVTGVVARLLSRQRYLNAEEIRKILADSADHPSGVGTWTRDWGYGKVNAAKAMSLLESKLRPPVRSGERLAAGRHRGSGSPG